tara:strand:- start:441 stop:857 length:417 start_codon:yes stop_codon:yes gene_type:complete
MSTLKTNTLTGTTSAGSINVTGEGGSTTTNLQQGLAKAHMRSPSDHASISDSFNVSSLDDDGTGDFGINYTNSFSTTNYYPMVHIPSGGSAGNSDGHFCECNSSGTSSGEHQSWYGDAGTNLTFTDWPTAHAIFGDLA